MTLEALHDALYDMMCLIDDICRKEGVRYFLDSGTAIGAARERDFVPWDDDVDFKVLREDYPAFKAAMLKHLPENYRFVEPVEFAPHFYDFTTRIIRLDFPLRNETEEDRYYGNLQNRLGIDVFIFEKTPASTLRRKLMQFETKLVYGLAMSKRYRVKSEKYTPAQKIAVTFLRLIGKPFSAQWCCKRYETISRRYENEPSAYRFPANYPLTFMVFIPEQAYSGTVYLPFRDRRLPMPSGYDTELSMIYGDYMHPPKDKSIYITHAQID